MADLAEPILQIGETSFKLVPDHFNGSVDYGWLTLKGAEVRGWALITKNKMLPHRFAVTVSGELNAQFEPNMDRQDLVKSTDQAVLRCGFKHFIDVDDIPGRFVLEVEVFALDEHAGIASKLKKYTPGYFIDLPIRNWQDFARLIQVPSTRIQHVPTLVYASIHVANRFKGDYVVRSGAACVIGYRLLDKNDFPKGIVEIFEARLAELVEMRPEVSPGVFLRWHTSLRLLAGYWAIKKNEPDAAYLHFSKIRDLAGDLPAWPTAVTNILLGILLSGYIAFKIGDLREAQENWRVAEDVFRTGCTLAKFQNVYAYDELLNAINVAKECHVGRIIAHSGGTISDPSLGPAGRQIELHNISNLASLPGDILAMIEKISRKDER